MIKAIVYNPFNIDAIFAAAVFKMVFTEAKVLNTCQNYDELDKYEGTYILINVTATQKHENDIFISSEIKEGQIIKTAYKAAYEYNKIALTTTDRKLDSILAKFNTNDLNAEELVFIYSNLLTVFEFLNYSNDSTFAIKQPEEWQEKQFAYFVKLLKYKLSTKTIQNKSKELNNNIVTLFEDPVEVIWAKRLASISGNKLINLSTTPNGFVVDSSAGVNFNYLEYKASIYKASTEY